MQVDEATWKANLEAHPYLEKMVAHLSDSLDLFVGIKTHRLNELWSPDDPKGFTKWMANGGVAFFATGAYGLHKIPDTMKEGKRDTWLCFSGPSEALSPTARIGVGFNLLAGDHLGNLKESTESGHDRIIRLLKRELAPKKPNTGPSPKKGPRPPDEDEDESDGSSDGSRDDDDESAPTTPWLRFSKRTLWKRSDLAVQARQAARDAAAAAVEKAAKAAKEQRERERALNAKLTDAIAAGRTVRHERDAAEARAAAAALKVAAADEAATKEKAAAAADAAAAREREDELLRRNGNLRALNMELLAKLEEARRDASAVEVRLNRQLLSQRDSKITELEKNLSAARAPGGLKEMDAPASPAMLRKRMERGHGRSKALAPVTRASRPLRARLAALKSFARLWFGVGWLWALALVLSQHAEGCTHFLSFARPREFVQRVINRGVKKAQGDPANAERAFLTRLVSIIGRKRWEKQRRALKYICSTIVRGDRAMFEYRQRTLQASMFQIKQVDDMCSRSDHDHARERLVSRYSAAVWVPHLGTVPIERLYDPAGAEVGAYADVFGTAVLCVRSSLEFECYNPWVDFSIRHDEHGPYLYSVVGDGCDEYPRDRRHTATEGSLSNRMEHGAACSPERQFPYLSVDAKETGWATGLALAKKEAAVCRLRSTLDPETRHEITVTLAPNAKDIFRVFLPDPDDKAAKTGGATVTMRLAIDYVPLFDLKHHAFCYRNYGTTGLYGGIMCSVYKDHLCLPECRLLSREEFMKDPVSNYHQHYFVHDGAYISECVADVKRHMDDFRSKNPCVAPTSEAEWSQLLEKEAKRYCETKRHSWWQEKPPMEFMKLVFFCVLHLDTNLGAVWVSLYDDYAKQLAASRNVPYGDPKSPHRRFHDAMDKAGLEPITARLRNRIPPEQQPQDFRLLGPHAIAAMQTIYLFDAALKVDNETEAEWLERSTLKTMALMHRGISTLHSQFKMQKSDVPLLVDMGRCMMRLVDTLHLPASYNLNYMCIGNPQLLELHMDRFAISELMVMGLQSLGCAQGPEAFHHDSGIRIPMQTSGRPGCHYTHLENALLIRTAAPDVLKFKFDPHSRKIHRHDEAVKPGHCRCCSERLSEPPCTPPTHVVITATMRDGFMVQQPLCCGCANDVAVIMHEVCAQPGGMRAGKVDRICSESNLAVARQERSLQFDAINEERRSDAQNHFNAMLAKHGETPDLGEAIGQLADADVTVGGRNGSDEPASFGDDSDDESSVASIATSTDRQGVPNLDDMLDFGDNDF